MRQQRLNLLLQRLCWEHNEVTLSFQKQKLFEYTSKKYMSGLGNLEITFYCHDPGAVIWRCSVKMVFLKISQNSQKNTCVKVSCNKVAGLRHRCFPVNFEKFSRTPFFRTPLVAAGHDLKVPIPLCMTFLIFVILSI